MWLFNLAYKLEHLSKIFLVVCTGGLNPSHLGHIAAPATQPQMFQVRGSFHFGALSWYSAEQPIKSIGIFVHNEQGTPVVL